MNPLIFGKNTESNIVNLTLKNDKLYIYKEEPTGVTEEIIPYSPWVLTNKKARPYSERLKGDQYWSWITTTTCDKYLALQGTWNKAIWLPRSIEECATLTEGFTLFKGMNVADVSILSTDIEGAGLMLDNEAEVFIIANTLRKNGVILRKLFRLDNYENSGEMIEDWCKWVREVNPSIICGHNFFSYDLPYLTHVFGRALPLGRDGSTLVFDEKVSRFRKDGSQEYDYHNARITGREIVDTFFLSMKWDQAARELPSYGLKPVIKFLGLEKQGRVFVDASKTRQYYENRHNDMNMWMNVCTYALDDSEDALKLYDKMIPAYFYLTQSVPKSLQQMINEATGSQLDSLMIRSYLQDGHSQPRTSGKADFEGAISMGIPGIYDWVFKADVSSLYPSIMLQYNIHDSQKDPNNHMIEMLRYFRDERLKHKKNAKTGDKYAEGMSEALKVAINSLYGFMGAGYLLYNFPDGASQVTRRGREILLKAVEWATGHTLIKVPKKVKNAGTEDEETQYEWIVDTSKKVCQGQGFTLVNTDTDSFSATMNRPITRDEFTKILKDLNSIYPDLISWEDDNIYEKVVVVKAKNYVLLKSQEYSKPGADRLTIKGSSLTDQKKEPALIEMLETMIDAIIGGRKYSLPEIYDKYVLEACNIENIERWSRKVTVTKSVLNAKRANEQKPLDAIHEAISRGLMEKISEGDKVWLYTTVSGEIQAMAKGEPIVMKKTGEPKMIPNIILRDNRLYNNDAHVEHYIDRVYSTLIILKNVLDLTQFTDYTVKRNRLLLDNLTKTLTFNKNSATVESA
jgi:DNA polymerase elongation subunit (family B)